MLTQTCKKCGEEKPIEDFGKTTDRKSGRKTQCKKCEWKIRKDSSDYNTKKKKYNEEYHLNKKYGLTVEGRKELLISQNHKCAICGIDEVEAKRGKLLVDHNHETGQVRELLCHNCNVLIGHCKESEDILLKSIQYLRKHKE